jgi:hypothetical protein
MAELTPQEQKSLSEYQRKFTLSYMRRLIVFALVQSVLTATAFAIIVLSFLKLLSLWWIFTVIAASGVHIMNWLALNSRRERRIERQWRDAVLRGEVTIEPDTSGQ